MPAFSVVAAPGSRGGAVVEFVCVICGTRFQRYASQVKGGAAHGHGTYCSPHCRGIGRGRAAAERLRSEDKRGPANPNWRGVRVKATCAVCGDRFTKGNADQRACGERCAHQLQGRAVTREGNGNWIDEPTYLLKNYRTLIDVTRCSVCGEIRRVIAHHLDGDRRHNIASNLVALCHWCHTTVHYLAKMRSTDHLPALLALAATL